MRQPSAFTTLFRCAQCGREGTRGFRVVGGFEDEKFGVIPVTVVCANTNACRKRWPKVLTDDE